MKRIVLLCILLTASVHAAPKMDVLIVGDSGQKAQAPLLSGARRQLEKTRAEMGLSSQDLPVDEYDLHQAGQKVAADRLHLSTHPLPLLAVCTLSNGKPTKVLWQTEGIAGNPSAACLRAMGFAGHQLGIKIPFLGLGSRPLSDAQRAMNDMKPGEAGIHIEQVVPGSPAALAGVETNDAVLEVDGSPVTNPGVLQSLVHVHKVGDTIELKIRRMGKEMTLKATLAEAPSR